MIDLTGEEETPEEEQQLREWRRREQKTITLMKRALDIFKEERWGEPRRKSSRDRGKRRRTKDKRRKRDRPKRVVHTVSTADGLVMTYFAISRRKLVDVKQECMSIMAIEAYNLDRDDVEYLKVQAVDPEGKPHTYNIDGDQWVQDSNTPFYVMQEELDKLREGQNITQFE